MNTAGKGREGEEHAAKFLEQDGYEIVGRNYRSYGAEVDLIALSGKTLVFAEVKHWDAYGFGEMGRILNRKKRLRIVKASKGFIHDNPVFDDYRIRYDLVFLADSGKIIEHIKDAFTETD